VVYFKVLSKNFFGVAEGNYSHERPEFDIGSYRRLFNDIVSAAKFMCRRMRYINMVMNNESGGMW
jgi:hypothetical protein